MVARKYKFRAKVHTLYNGRKEQGASFEWKYTQAYSPSQAARNLSYQGFVFPKFYVETPEIDPLDPDYGRLSQSK
jgi:hypothetical protein